MKKSNSKFIYIFALLISIFIFLVSFITFYFLRLSSVSPFWQIIIVFLASIVAGGVITYSIIMFNPVISEAMATLRRMLRLESLSNPILLKLSSEAPGTYHHSLNVSNLAQKAAKAVGADSLLVRIAAYYHDIGKLDEPIRYVENQAGIEVPTSEDATSIRNNAKIIISHVNRGVRIAQENNFPEEIVNLIEEHHGTTKALYFYGKAKEKGLKIKKTDFRYDGPVPQSKESAILMLADCVEATARSKQILTPEIIQEIVIKTIEEKMNENQFKHASLDEKDFQKIKTSLEESLLATYHQRLEYNHA